MWRSEKFAARLAVYRSGYRGSEIGNGFMWIGSSKFIGSGYVFGTFENDEFIAGRKEDAKGMQGNKITVLRKPDEFNPRGAFFVGIDISDKEHSFEALKKQEKCDDVIQSFLKDEGNERLLHKVYNALQNELEKEANHGLPRDVLFKPRPSEEAGYNVGGTAFNMDPNGGYPIIVVQMGDHFKKTPPDNPNPPKKQRTSQ